jgi:Domain of unknown function (DUF4365)
MAHIESVVGYAGANLAAGSRRNDYGIDGSFHNVVERDGRLVESGFRLDFQAKSTTRWQHDGDFVIYDLEAKTFNDLVTRHPSAPRCALILLCLPGEPQDWIVSLEASLTLRHCCYWAFIEGEETGNEVTKRIRIPRRNVLTADAVRQLLNEERRRREDG